MVRNNLVMVRNNPEMVRRKLAMVRNNVVIVRCNQIMARNNAAMDHYRQVMVRNKCNNRPQQRINGLKHPVMVQNNQVTPE